MISIRDSGSYRKSTPSVTALSAGCSAAGRGERAENRPPWERTAICGNCPCNRPRRSAPRPTGPCPARGPRRPARRRYAASVRRRFSRWSSSASTTLSSSSGVNALFPTERQRITFQPIKRSPNFPSQIQKNIAGNFPSMSFPVSRSLYFRTLLSIHSR